MKMRSSKVLFVVCVSLSLLLASCHKGKEIPQRTEEKICEIAKEYVLNEVKVSTVDSVKIDRIDSINKYNYTMIALQFLRDSQRSMSEGLRSALAMGDTLQVRQIETTQHEVEQTMNFLEERRDHFDEKDTHYLMYMVNAYFFSKGKRQGMIFFLTPDFKVHTFDPMDTHFVE